MHASDRRQSFRPEGLAYIPSRPIRGEEARRIPSAVGRRVASLAECRGPPLTVFPRPQIHCGDPPQASIPARPRPKVKIPFPELRGQELPTRHSPRAGTHPRNPIRFNSLAPSEFHSLTGTRVHWNPARTRTTAGLSPIPANTPTLPDAVEDHTQDGTPRAPRAAHAAPRPRAADPRVGPRPHAAALRVRRAAAADQRGEDGEELPRADDGEYRAPTEAREGGAGPVG